jgi:predicted negative regulator of RcsB-dependent stress response
MSSAIKAGLAKPDTFSSEWFRLHSRSVLLVVAVVVGTALGAYLYIRSNEIKRQRAEQALDDALQQLYGVSASAGEAALAGVVNRYSGTHSGTVAAMRLAISKLDQRKFGDAIRVVDEALPKADKKLFASSLHELRGSALSDSGAFAEAAASFEKAAAEEQFDSRKAELTYEAGEMYARAGDEARASALLQEIAEGPPSAIRGRALRLLGELMVSPAKVGGGTG